MEQLEYNLEDALLHVNALNKQTHVISDIISSICGEHLGTGAFRRVYDYNLEAGYVVKIEEGSSRCNVVEALVWEEVQGLCGDLEWVKKWFAPIKWISPGGHILVMQKTELYPKNERMQPPEKIPKFLWDIKPENFGWIGRNYVCHDYGQFYNMIHYPKSMKKINWNKL